MSYNRIHRFLLRSVASRGVLPMIDAVKVMTNFADDADLPPIKELVEEINEKIRPLQQSIKITNNELTDEELLVFLSLGYDDATKSQNLFNVNELEYFRLLIEDIMTTEMRQVAGIRAMNLAGKMKNSFTKTHAQKMLDTFCRMHYLDKDENNYALGVRAIHEFESYLRQNMPDTIEDCCLCKQIVFRGCNCPGCGLAVHTRCLNKYLEKVQKWPCCKCDYSAVQLENMRNAERLTQSLETTQLLQEDNTAADELTQETLPEVSVTMDVIPEISQRITRKRKRNDE